MARCISSVVVVLSLKTVKAVKDMIPMKSFVISLTFISGSTLSHAVNFVSRHPLIKGLLRDYEIINLTFNYSDL
nr:MAG TPA: hypothetical protein [Microviridae sp.]